MVLRRSKGVVFVGPVLMHTLKEAFEERMKTPLPKRNQKIRNPNGYEPLGMHAHERLSVLKDLKRHGYKVVVPVRQYDVRASPHIQTFVGAAKKAGARIIDTSLQFSPSESQGLFGVEGSGAREPSASWIADAHRVIGNKIYTPTTYETRAHLRRANITHPLVYSSAGESGAIVGHGKVLLVTKKVNESEVTMLRKQGHRVYVMPTFSKRERIHYRPDAYKFEKEFDRFIWNDPNNTSFLAPGKTIYKPVFKNEAHLDIRINIIEKANLIIVDPTYYKTNRELIKRIAKENKMRVAIVKDSALLPTNILWLADGRIMINKSTKLQAVLEKFGLKEGRDFLVSSREIKYNKFLGGGLGCFATSMPTNKGRYIKWAKKTAQRTKPLKPNLLSPEFIQYIKPEKIYENKCTGQVFFSINHLLEFDTAEKDNFLHRDYKKTLQTRKELFENGWLSLSSRTVEVAGKQYKEYDFRPVRDLLEHISPSKEIVDALSGVMRHDPNTIFERSRVEMGPDLGSETSFMIRIGSETRVMTQEEQKLDELLMRLCKIGVLKRKLHSGDGLFNYSATYIPSKIPKAWKPLIKGRNN